MEEENYDRYRTQDEVRTPFKIETKILAPSLAHAHRTITEALDIAEQNPDHNRKQENVSQRVLYIDLTEDRRKGVRKRLWEWRVCVRRSEVLHKLPT